MRMILFASLVWLTAGAAHADGVSVDLRLVVEATCTLELGKARHNPRRVVLNLKRRCNTEHAVELHYDPALLRDTDSVAITFQGRKPVVGAGVLRFDGLRPGTRRGRLVIQNRSLSKRKFRKFSKSLSLAILPS